MMDPRLIAFTPSQLREFADQLEDEARDLSIFTRVTVAFECREIRTVANNREAFQRRQAGGSGQ